MSAIHQSRLFITKYILPKLKFGIGSAISTSIDYSIFFGLYWADLGIKIAFIQGIAQASGMLSNFIIQRNFIFKKERGLFASFGWSLTFSAIAIVLSSVTIHWMYTIDFFQTYTILMKLMVTGVFFFFNYYTKQFSFEKKVSL
jgi:putative flippase GtrA